MGSQLGAQVDHVRRAVAAFAPAHADETFYAFTIDAGMMCLFSEEGLRRTLEKYALHFEDDRAHPIDHAAVPEEFIEGERRSWDPSDDPPFDEYLAKSVAYHNKVIVPRSQAEPNPYRAPAETHALRFRPGDTPYQGFAALDNVEDAYETHYDLGGFAQQTSDYAVAMRDLVLALRRNAAVVFAPLRTVDFRIFRAGHDY